MSSIDNSNSNEKLFELLTDIKSGKSDCFLTLINKYRDRIACLASSFGFSDSEREDLIQEGYIALYKSAITYEETKGASFTTYVTLCAKRRMINWIEKNTKKGFYPIPLSSFEISELEKIAVSNESVEDDIILKDQVADLVSLADRLLSEKEKTIFDLYIRGYSPDEICKMLDITKKSYDNALFRIRTKLRSAT